jgi:GR25 family glycosyltransferase involved in LPS biosynthesis
MDKKVIASFDCNRQPSDNEIVIVYGNYPDWHESLPCSSKLYRHASLFFDIKHDVVEYHPSWESIDIIYILNLEDRSDRYSDTLLSLCSVHAPLHRIHHYKAKKDGLPPYVGASKNHVDVIEHFQQSDLNHCLVLEDDIVFLDQKNEVWNNLDSFFKRSYDYSICFLAISKIGERQPFDDLLSMSKQACTTSSAYILNKRTSQTVLDVTKEGLEKMQETGDHHNFCIDRYWCKLPNILFFKRKLAYQRPSFSNLTKSVNFHLD